MSIWHFWFPSTIRVHSILSGTLSALGPWGLWLLTSLYLERISLYKFMSPLMEVFLFYVSPVLSPCLQRKPQASYFIAFMEIYLDLIPKENMWQEVPSRSRHHTQMKLNCCWPQTHIPFWKGSKSVPLEASYLTSHNIQKKKKPVVNSPFQLDFCFHLFIL